MADLAGKRVIVTGGSTGIGAAIAEPSSPTAPRSASGARARSGWTPSARSCRSSPRRSASMSPMPMPSTPPSPARSPASAASTC